MSQQQNKTWWEGNWKWFVPVGCLGTLALFAGFIALTMFLVMGLVKSSGAYSNALAKAQGDLAVQETLGIPIEDGILVSGEISVAGPSGEANIAIPISGPDGKATIYAVASKSRGQWIYSTLVVEVKETRQMIDLLE